MEICGFLMEYLADFFCDWVLQHSKSISNEYNDAGMPRNLIKMSKIRGNWQKRSFVLSVLPHLFSWQWLDNNIWPFLLCLALKCCFSALYDDGLPLSKDFHRSLCFCDVLFRPMACFSDLVPPSASVSTYHRLASTTNVHTFIPVDPTQPSMPK